MVHLAFDHYLQALLGRFPLRLLSRHASKHLLESCAICRSRSRTTLDVPDRNPSLPDPRHEEPVSDGSPPDLRGRSLTDLESAERLQSLTRQAAREAREDLRVLLRLPLDQRPGRVERARTRFRSRAFAELVLAESTLRVRTAAWEAARLAELIPTILCRSEARGRLPWVRLLVARATAHRANALRVAGDLPAADAAFADLRLQTMNQPVPDVLADAEIDSLEASLRFDQRRLPAAEALLQRAERIYRDRHRPVDLGRTLMIKANLRRLQDRPREIEPLLTEAAQLFDSKEPYLYLGTVQGRVNALLDLDRPADAAQLLAAEGDAYERHGDDSMNALRTFAAARIALQLQQHRQAEQGFLQVRDQFLALDRDYDAILASLYLADTLLASGKLSALRRLATDLVPLFQSRGVERETLASLRLLAQAVQAETLTVTLVAELRRSLQAGSPATIAPATASPSGER